MATVLPVTFSAAKAFTLPTAPLNVTLPVPALTVRGEAARLVSRTKPLTAYWLVALASEYVVVGARSFHLPCVPKNCPTFSAVGEFAPLGSPEPKFW